MGCLVLRSALNDPECPIEAKNGKVVLLAPPNRSSCMGRYLNKYSFCRKIAKDKSGKQLMNEKSFEYLGAFPQSKEKILIIAGNFSINPFIHKSNDGVVLVDETLLYSPHKHIVILSEHITIVFSKKAFSFAKDFLEN